MNAFGLWLREARRAMRLSTRELARISGFSSGYISKLELGKQQSPKREVVQTLVIALQRPGTEALSAAGYTCEAATMTPEAWEFDSLIQRVHAGRRRQVMNAVRSLVELVPGDEKYAPEVAG